MDDFSTSDTVTPESTRERAGGTMLVETTGRAAAASTNDCFRKFVAENCLSGVADLSPKQMGHLAFGAVESLAPWQWTD